MDDVSNYFNENNLSFDINEISLEELQSLEKIVCLTTIKTIVEYFNAVSLATSTNDELENIANNDTNNLSDIKKYLKVYDETKRTFAFVYAPIYTQKMIDKEEAKMIDLLKVSEVLTQYNLPTALDALYKIYQASDEYIKYSLKAGAISETNCCKKDFVKKVDSCHKKMNSAIMKASKIIDETNHPLLLDSTAFVSLYNLIDELSQYMNPELLKEIVTTNNHVTITDSPEEIQRKKLITSVNDTYSRLQSDYLKDLKNQYSLSVKDLMKKLLKKVSNFENNFEMPLAITTNTKKAENAYKELESIISIIDDISSNAYSTGVWEQ